MMSPLQRKKLEEKALTEAKKFAVIALYLWVLLSVLEVHRLAVLRQFHLASIPGYRLGFAAVNALVMGKVILIGEALHVGERLTTNRLIVSALFKSAMFAILLVCFDIVEEVIVGVIHGKSIVASIPQIGGGGVEGAVLMAIVAFVVLIPFFLFIELQRVIGGEKLYSLIVKDRARADAA